MHGTIPWQARSASSRATLAGWLVATVLGCGGATEGAPGTGGLQSTSAGGQLGSGGIGGGGGLGQGGAVASGGTAPTHPAGVDASISDIDASIGDAGAGGGVDTGGGAGEAGGGQHVVALVQAAKAQATELTQADVVELVSSAVEQAGGLGFIEDGMTVVLKPNLVTVYLDFLGRKVMDQTVNGITTDWRVTKAVADLVRARNPSGKILVMEGAVVPTLTAFELMGYTPANFGPAVDELIAVEGASCSERGTDGLELRASASGTLMWVNRRYVTADVVISLPTLKTHLQAGITGAVKNLGIGMTPVGQYSEALDGGTRRDCTRGQSAAHIDHSSPEALGQFIHDYYSIRPADFVVVDALQGLQNGPASLWSGTSYADDRMNMRLVLAGRNAVAVDTVGALVMKCDPAKVPYLTKLEASGFGSTDLGRITVVGKQPGEVARPFAGAQTAICPGI